MSNNSKNSIQYHYDKFPPQKLDLERILPFLTKASVALSRYDQMLKQLMLPNSAMLISLLENQEAVLTSRLEGTVSTLDEILQYEAEDSKNNNNARSDIKETILYKVSLVKAQQAMEEGQKLSPFLLRSAHQNLLSFGRGTRKNPGKYKTKQNYIVDLSNKKNILFTPIAPEHLDAGVDKLFNYIDTDKQIPLIKVALAHVEFEALHPFEDGNGRIGRMLITLMLWSLGLTSKPHFHMSYYLEKDKDLYINKMRNVSQHDDWDSWCIFFFEVVEKQAIRNLQIAEKIASLYEEMKEPFSQALSSRWSIQVLDFIFTNPIFQNNGLTKKVGIQPQSVMRITKVLVEKKLIRVIIKSSGRRGTLYAFEPLLKLLRV